MVPATSQLRPMSAAWDWQLLGRCRDRSGGQFFHPDDDLGHNSRRRREAAAIRECGRCPVRRQCATHALRLGEEYGVWGGFSECDLRVLRRLGWQDTVDQHLLADIRVLEFRLARARATAAGQG